MKINRLHSLDAMRGILMLLGVYFHIAVFHYEDSALILFTTYSHFFRMPAFFLISGFFGALLYYQKGSIEMILNRIKRILLPLIITLPFMHIFIVFSREFLGYQLENIGIVNSLIKALKTFNSPKAFFPLEYTHHLWFFNFLFTISFFIYLGDNIFFLHNSSSPLRMEGVDWSNTIDGTRSDLIWNKYVDFEDIPQITNPSSGWIASTNQDPFKVTASEDNLNSKNYSPTLGLQTRMTNRAHRSIELFNEYEKVTEETFDLIKFDNKYSKQSRSYKYISELFEKDFESDNLNQARDVLREWDLGTNLENTSAALGVCVLSSEWISEQGQRIPQEPEISFKECVEELSNTYGKVDPLWSERNFIVRGDKKISVQGGPDVLRAIYGRNDDSGDLSAAGGDGLYIHVSWDKNGFQSSKSIHQYGSATQDSDSKHYSDQMDLYVGEKYKPTFFDQKDLANNTAESYYVP